MVRAKHTPYEIENASGETSGRFLKLSFKRHILCIFMANYEYE